MLKGLAARALACLLILAAAVPAFAAAPAPQMEFGGKFELVPLFHNCQPVRKLSNGKSAKCPIVTNGHQYYALRNTLTVRTPAGDTVTIYGGSRTDLASIPRLVWNILPPDGPWAMAAVAHDVCYRTRGTFTFYKHAGLSRARPYARAECDGILRDGMEALRVTPWKRFVIYQAVRWGGEGGWGR